MRQIFLDTETTGMEPHLGHRIIEIGAVEMVDRRLTGNEFHCLINPKMMMTDEVIKVHHITNEQLQGKPEFHEIAEDFINFVSDSEVIIHNAPFDIKFLDAELERVRGMLNFERYISNCIDSLALAKQIRPGQRNNLDALCAHFGISLTEREQQGHGAILDSKLTAQVYIYMTSGQTGFDFDSMTTAPEHSLNVSSMEQWQQLKVIKANDAELEEHNRVLDNIEQSLDKEGNIDSLWRQIERQRENRSESVQ